MSVKIRNLPTGVPGLDEILGGGVPEFSFNILGGGPGSGKTTLAHQVMFANATPEKPAIFFTILGEPTIKMLRYQQQFSFFDGEKLNESVYFVNLSRAVLDNSLESVMNEIVREVEAVRPGIVVVDSLAGFEMAVAPGFRTDFREALYRMIGALTSSGVTVVTTVEVAESFTEIEFSGYTVSFLSDDIIRLRYVELDGEVGKVMFVVKMRGGDHSKQIRRYEIKEKGVVVSKEPLRGYRGLLTGIPRLPER